MALVHSIGWQLQDVHSYYYIADSQSELLRKTADDFDSRQIEIYGINLTSINQVTIDGSEEIQWVATVTLHEKRASQ